MKRIGLISLGCEKNLVDSEMILGLLKKYNVSITTNFDIADIIIVNTCGFINSAKEEAINTIMDVLDYKENECKIIVTGCLVQRYYDDLVKEIPDVDLWIPIKDYYKFGELIAPLLEEKLMCNSLEMTNRYITTAPYLAYVRIGDGCNNRCAYCAIPLIRGNLKSRPEDEIVKEVEELVKQGRLEICLISQDLSNYGYDINTTLASLLKKLVKIEGLKWLRLLYLYPDEITDEFLEVVKDNDKILQYFDIPLQHASDKILKYMRRRGSKSYVTELINKIRKMMPEAIIRTTMIVGFPHESEKDFNELNDFISEIKFNHMGSFTYSKEEDTEGYKMSGQISQKLKNERMNKLMDTQRWISLSLNKEMIGKEYECIIESYNHTDNVFNGRTYAFAPDDIDGGVIISNNLNYDENVIGTIQKILITEADFYDLKAEFKK